MNWAIGIYATCTAIWGVVWGISALVNLADWRQHREETYRAEQAAKNRGNFLGSMMFLACTPIWPVPVLVVTYRGIRSVIQEVRRGVAEEVIEGDRKVQDGRR